MSFAHFLHFLLLVKSNVGTNSVANYKETEIGKKNETVSNL